MTSAGAQAIVNGDLLRMRMELMPMEDHAARRTQFVGAAGRLGATAAAAAWPLPRRSLPTDVMPGEFVGKLNCLGRPSVWAAIDGTEPRGGWRQEMRTSRHRSASTPSGWRSARPWAIGRRRAPPRRDCRRCDGEWRRRAAGRRSGLAEEWQTACWT